MFVIDLEEPKLCKCDKCFRTNQFIYIVYCYAEDGSREPCYYSCLPCYGNPLRPLS